ncbi:MAG: LysM peptidoglycan-binding domain-containing protein, partial [Caldilineae bacterium]
SPDRQSLQPLDAEESLPPIPGNEDLTPKPPTPTPKPKLFTYTVKAGDTLYSIARKYDITVEDILRYNNLQDPNNLRVGQELQIPGKPSAGTPSDEGYIHIVQPGETLFGIAQKYGVPLDALAEANQIADPSNIIVGQKLIIPNVARQEGGTGGPVVRVYVVKPGDTLTSIAARYGVTPQSIVEANKLENPNRLIVGQTLTIPAP